MGETSTVLAVGSHPDDIEVGCGRTIARYCSEGTRVICIYLGKGEKTGETNTRKEESIQACKLP